MTAKWVSDKFFPKIYSNKTAKEKNHLCESHWREQSIFLFILSYLDDKQSAKIKEIALFNTFSAINGKNSNKRKRKEDKYKRIKETNWSKDDKIEQMAS